MIAGPNGAGKTTFAKEFLPNYADCKNFINADLIAQGVAPFSPEKAVFRAGRLVLKEIELYAARGESFGFETTLSGRGYLDLLRRLKTKGYAVHVFYLWIATVDLALSRIKARVSSGGHDVPAVDVRRRFERSIRNFLTRYRPLADSWILFDNTGELPRVIASQVQGKLQVPLYSLYNDLLRGYANT